MKSMAMKLICETKIVYLSKGEAYDAMARIDAKVKQRRGKKRAKNYVYRCISCKRYHTSMSKDKRCYDETVAIRWKQQREMMEEIPLSDYSSAE